MALMSEFAGLTSRTADMTEIPDTADIIETNEVNYQLIKFAADSIWLVAQMGKKV